MKKLSYGERSLLATNPSAKKLFSIMEEKKSNLALSADVTTKDELLKILDQVSSEICLLKTHIDILEDFDVEFIYELKKRAKKDNFLLFEDRKFADIGNTVKHQYEDGIYHIASWADIVNAHILPGPGIIEGLKQVGEKRGRGLLLLAQMSSKDNLLDPEYTQKAVEMALKYDDFVIGFITQKKLTDDPRFIHMTPGVKRKAGGDGLGQVYRTPHTVIVDDGCDLIIVGRGILQAENPHETAALYRKEGWQAYEQR